MLVAIMGRARSGTTLLQQLCHGHPEMAITMELANFEALGKSFENYRAHLLKRNVWARDYHIDNSYAGKPGMRLRNLIYVLRHLSRVYRYRKEPIGVPAIEAALRSTYPSAHVVGDKFPRYMRLLPELTKLEDMRCVVVYRDCRDVTSSCLRMTRTVWRNRSWVVWSDTAQKVAEGWVRAIEVMEHHADKCHIIRYEDLVHRPGPVLEALGHWLGVEPDGFPAHIIRDTSIGKYKHGLSEEELATVVDIAGPTMARLGYLEPVVSGGH